MRREWLLLIIEHSMIVKIIIGRFFIQRKCLYFWNFCKKRIIWKIGQHLGNVFENFAWFIIGSSRSANCLIQTNGTNQHKTKQYNEEPRIQKAFRHPHNDTEKHVTSKPFRFNERIYTNEWMNKRTNERTTDRMNDRQQQCQKSNESRTNHYVNNFQIKINAHWKRNYSANCCANLTAERKRQMRNK